MEINVQITGTPPSIDNFEALKNAIFNGEKNIEIKRSFACTHTIILPEAVNINGVEQENGELPLLSFINTDGIGISTNNSISNLNIDVPSQNKAIYSSLNKTDIGTFRLENITLKGQVSLIFRAGVNKGNIIINDVNIVSSDTRHYLEQPQKYGVNVLQGALTVYNLNPENKSNINLQITNLSIGIKNVPVSGSGVFIAGYGDDGGKITVSKLHTKSIYSNGKIPPGVSNFITAGVFVLNGAYAKEVVTDGEIITYGTNDMVLDVWGTVENWTSNNSIISYGASGVGFVNFGTVKNFTINAPLQTYGTGARGYNQYDGTVENIKFKSIETFGDGSVGIQISKKIGDITVQESIITHGSVGSSLVKGHYVSLPAYGLSIKEGGCVNNIIINGNIETYGDNVTSYIKEKGGTVSKLEVKGEIIAHGQNTQQENVE
jgi:hypothetical protein